MWTAWRLPQRSSAAPPFPSQHLACLRMRRLPVLDMYSICKSRQPTMSARTGRPSILLPASPLLSTFDPLRRFLSRSLNPHSMTRTHPLPQLPVSDRTPKCLPSVWMAVHLPQQNLTMIKTVRYRTDQCTGARHMPRVRRLQIQNFRSIQSLD